MQFIQLIIIWMMNFLLSDKDYDEFKEKWKANFTFADEFCGQKQEVFEHKKKVLKDIVLFCLGLL